MTTPYNDNRIGGQRGGQIDRLATKVIMTLVELYVSYVQLLP